MLKMSWSESLSKRLNNNFVLYVYVAGGRDTLRTFPFRKTAIDFSYKTQQEEGRLSEKK